MGWKKKWPHLECSSFHCPEGCNLEGICLMHSGFRRPMWASSWGTALSSVSCLPPPAMTTKMKGFFKGFKYISQIFVYKEHEMEIGYPTDVRHVAHIGWDSSPLNAPSWMNEFKAASDFSASSLSSFGQSRETSWASQDFDQARGLQATTTATIADPGPRPPADIPKAPKKTKRKKAKQQSPGSRSSSRSSKSRAASFATAHGDDGELRGESG